MQLWKRFTELTISRKLRMLNGSKMTTVAANGTESEVDLTELGVLDGLTATTEELNIMDGVTATTDEINAVADASGRIVASADAGTLALTTATHGERIVYFSDADGTITLPNATGTGSRFKVVLKTAATAMSITVTPSTDESFVGGVMGVDDDADAAYAWKAETDDDTISLDGTATGGDVGDWLQFTDIDTGVWLVEGFITQSGGAEATPFSAAITS